MEGLNTQIRRLYDDVVKLFNSYSDVPIEAKRLVCKDISGLIDKAANDTIIAEMTEASEAANESEEVENAENVCEGDMGERTVD